MNEDDAPKTQTESDGGDNRMPPRTASATDDSGAGDVVRYAEEEARRLGQNFIGTEMLLIGILREGASIGAHMLRESGIDVTNARTLVEQIVGRGSGCVAVEIPFTPRGKRALELSWEEARNLGSPFISINHVLLGILAEGGGAACKVIELTGNDRLPLATRLRDRIKISL